MSGDRPTSTRPCCDDLASALAITYIVPDHRHQTWLAYGADFDTVSSGAPEIRYWPIAYCPFCGERLPSLAPANGPGAAMGRPDHQS